MVFLCWNLNGAPIRQLIAELVRSRDVDVVILLECEARVNEVRDSLNMVTGAEFQHCEAPEERKTIRVFSRFPREFVRPVEESGNGRYSLRHIIAPSQTDVLLVIVHFSSKLWWSEDSQALECTELARTIVSAEKRIGHHRTILVGDLNMNPFEKGVVGAAGLNAAMTRHRAQKNCGLFRIANTGSFIIQCGGTSETGDQDPRARITTIITNMSRIFGTSSIK